MAAAAASSTKYQPRALPIGRVDHDAGGEAALGLVLAAEEDDDEVQRQRRHREVQAAQAQARQAEDQAEQRADRGGSRQRDPDRRAELLEQDAGGERAGGEQPGVTERDLAGVAGEQHQRHRADRAEQHLVGRGRARAAPAMKGSTPSATTRAPRAMPSACACRGSAKSSRVAGAEVAAHTRSSSSRVPNRPQGRTTSIASSTTNGTTSREQRDRRSGSEALRPRR